MYYLDGAIYQAGFTTNTANQSFTLDVTWQPPPENDDGGALVGAMVPRPPLAPVTGATVDLQT